MVFPSTEQQRVIEHLDGAAVLFAAVGTGKTQTLTERVAYSVETGVDPGRILALTFTNRAATELKGRIRYRLKEKSHCLTARTFHSLCAHISLKMVVIVAHLNL